MTLISGTRQWSDGQIGRGLAAGGALLLATACSANGGDPSRPSASGGDGGDGGSVNWGSGGTGAVGGSDASGGSGAEPASGGTGAGGGTGGLSGSGGVGAGPNPGDPLTLNIGPVNMGPGEELTVCVDVRMPTTQPFELARIDSELTEGGHHLIVYTSGAQSETLTPYPCSAAADILDPTIVPLFIAQQPHTNVTFPPGVAFQLPAARMLKLELHFLNTDAQAKAASAKVDFHGIDPDMVTQHSNFIFWGPTVSILLPPNAPTTVTEFYPFNKQLSIFGLTTHTHQWGERTTVKMGPRDTGAVVYENTDWEEPPLQVYEPPLQSASPTDGLRISCEFYNRSAFPVGFGESAGINEMCFLWAYYYPDQGPDVRVIIP